MSYVAIISHSPAQCPGADKDISQSVGAALSRIGEVSQRMGVSDIKFHVLLPGHSGVVVMEAPDYSTARKFLMEMRVDTWNDVTLYESVTPQEAMAISAERFAADD